MTAQDRIREAMERALRGHTFSPATAETEAVFVRVRYDDLAALMGQSDAKTETPVGLTQGDLRKSDVPQAAPPPPEKNAAAEALAEQALNDVINPLGYLRRMAEAEGAVLGGMAYAIANDISTVQRIAKDALTIINQGASPPSEKGSEVYGVSLTPLGVLKKAHLERPAQ